MAKTYWAGLDIGLVTTRLCIIDETGETVHEADCASDVASVRKELSLFRRRRKSLRIGMEAGLGVHLARGLKDLGYDVDIYEARQLSKFLRLRRNKTDAGDANGIAQAGRLAAPMVAKVHLKSVAAQTLATRLALRRHLVRSRTAAFRVLNSQLEVLGGRLPCSTRSAAFGKEVEKRLRKLFGTRPSPLATDLRALLARCDRLVAEQEALDLDLKQQASSDELCRRLMAIPGVGPICALTFTAAVSEPGRFRHSADVGAYLGLTPRLRQSGLSRKTGRISRMGHRGARTLLVQSSIHFMRSADPGLALHAWASAIEQRRGRGKARVALARKLAAVMLAIWKTGDAFHPRLVGVPA